LVVFTFHAMQRGVFPSYSAGNDGPNIQIKLW